MYKIEQNRNLKVIIYKKIKIPTVGGRRLARKARYKGADIIGLLKRCTIKNKSHTI